MTGVIWLCSFKEWVDNKAYYDYSVGALNPSKKYYMCLLYDDRVKASWGIALGLTSRTNIGYCPASKIDNGDVTVRIDLRESTPGPGCNGITDDTKFVYTPPNDGDGEAKGKITNIDAPAELAEGDEIDVTATMKNEGGALGEFRFYLLDENGNTIDKEPDTYYKNIAAGVSWTQKLTSNLKPWDMPDHDVTLILELRRQT